MNLHLRRLIPASLVLALTLLGSAGSISARSAPAPDFERVLSRASAAGPPAYRAFRRLDAGNPGSNRLGWLEAWTELIPPGTFRYEVTAEGGSEYIRNKVLRGMLNGELKLIADGYPTRAPLIGANYTFADGGIVDAGLQRILLTPLRKAHGIVRGAVVIDPADGRMVRIEGRLVKNPSFWIRNTDVVWKYGRVGDAVVPVEVSSTANVRLFGASTFRMTYDYVMIGGRPVGGRVAEK
ncbi:MAG: hypothetical protein WC815_04440 [Vicinamibacterales bacterium]|jgi:hypothetical protein